MLMTLAHLFLRFAIFWIKIGLSCLFVLFLQVQIGSKTIEQWLEQGLKNSAFGQYLKQSVSFGKELAQNKFPQLRGLAQNKFVLKNSVLEFHSGLFQQMEDAFDEALPLESEQRLPATHTPQGG